MFMNDAFSVADHQDNQRKQREEHFYTADKTVFLALTHNLKHRSTRRAHLPDVKRHVFERRVLCCRATRQPTRRAGGPVLHRGQEA